MATVRRRILDFSIVAIAFGVPIFLLRAGLADPSEIGGVERAILRVSAPLQTAVSYVIEGVGSTWSGYVGLVDVEEENRELRAENRRLRLALAESLRLSQDAALLEELIGLKSRTAAETVAARVVSAEASSFFRIARIRIDRGLGQLRSGLPVIDENGLVGRIHKMYGDYSDVLLLSDPQSSIAVALPRTGAQGVLTGLGRDDSYASRIEYLDREKEVTRGDLVVTSGLGGDLPAGIPVGRIATIETKEYGRYQEVTVDPAVDHGALRAVLVLLAPPPPPDPDGKAAAANSVVGELSPL